MGYRFTVYGVAQPKGSTKSFPIRRANGVIGTATTSANPKLASWEALVRHEAQRLPDRVFFAREVPVRVDIVTRLPRPVSLPKRVTAHVRKPDGDKLTRAVLDALTGVCFQDDAQVNCIVMFKLYALPTEAPSVTVGVSLGPSTCPSAS